MKTERIRGEEKGIRRQQGQQKRKEEKREEREDTYEVEKREVLKAKVIKKGKSETEEKIEG